jgi:ribosomal protein S27AE
MKIYTMQPSATNAVSGSNALLEHQCPQCGAGVNLAETDRIFTCPFCRVRLFIAGAEGYLSYFIAPPEVDIRNCFFMPYFRLRGIRFVVNGEKIMPGLVDYSAIAVASLPQFPQSLGVRPQSMRLRFVEPATPGVFVAVQQHFNVMKTVAARAGTVERTEESTAFPLQQSFSASQATLCALIGETASCIYAPYHVHNETIFDAVSGAAAGHMSETIVRLLHDTRPAFPAFISTLCPSCGSDLSGDRDSLVLLCGRCGNAWQAMDNTLNQVDISVWEPRQPFSADAWIPFWRLSVKGKRCRLSSMADFVKLTNLPKAVLPPMEQQPFFFWTPAFKANPELFLRLCRLLTVHQQPVSDEATLPRDRNAVFYPATLPSSECFEAMPVALADISATKRKTVLQLENESFSLSSARLVLVPFILRGREYFQPELNTVIAINALKWGRTL